MTSVIATGTSSTGKMTARRHAAPCGRSPVAGRPDQAEHAEQSNGGDAHDDQPTVGPGHHAAIPAGEILREADGEARQEDDEECSRPRADAQAPAPTVVKSDEDVPDPDEEQHEQDQPESGGSGCMVKPNYGARPRPEVGRFRWGNVRPSLRRDATV